MRAKFQMPISVFMPPKRPVRVYGSNQTPQGISKILALGELEPIHHAKSTLKYCQLVSTMRQGAGSTRVAQPLDKEPEGPQVLAKLKNTPRTPILTDPISQLCTASQSDEIPHRHYRHTKLAAGSFLTR